MKLLVIRPARTGKASDGDEVVHRKTIDHLKRSMDVDVVELETVGGVKRYTNLLEMVPLEVARHISAQNAVRVRTAVQSMAPDAVCFLNETSFPAMRGLDGFSGGVILYAHNVHSQILTTRPSLFNLVLAPTTRAFETRHYARPDVSLVCISESDARYVRTSGLRQDVAVAPPGAPPAVELTPDASVEAAIVLTGSYGWWRKRKDLKAFAAQPATGGVAYYVQDPTAATALSGSHPSSELDWGAAVRFGLITDSFVGGFKLKSTEYVACNCMVLSRANLLEEFEGLPHADAFVRLVRDRKEAEQIVHEVTERADADFVQRFREFKAACLMRYEWDRSMEILTRTVVSAVAASRQRH